MLTLYGCTMNMEVTVELKGYRRSRPVNRLFFKILDTFTFRGLNASRYSRSLSRK